jgi:hypothetical protein
MTSKSTSRSILSTFDVSGVSTMSDIMPSTPGDSAASDERNDDHMSCSRHYGQKDLPIRAGEVSLEDDASGGMRRHLRIFSTTLYM